MKTLDEQYRKTIRLFCEEFTNNGIVFDFSKTSTGLLLCDPNIWTPSDDEKRKTILDIENWLENHRKMEKKKSNILWKRKT